MNNLPIDNAPVTRRGDVIPSLWSTLKTILLLCFESRKNICAITGGLRSRPGAGGALGSPTSLGLGRLSKNQREWSQQIKEALG